MGKKKEMGMGKKAIQTTNPLQGKWAIDLNIVPLIFSLAF